MRFSTWRSGWEFGHLISVAFNLKIYTGLSLCYTFLSKRPKYRWNFLHPEDAGEALVDDLKYSRPNRKVANSQPLQTELTFYTSNSRLLKGAPISVLTCFWQYLVEHRIAKSPGLKSSGLLLVYSTGF